VKLGVGNRHPEIDQPETMLADYRRLKEENAQLRRSRRMRRSTRRTN
jgi:hypothetical protein